MKKFKLKNWFKKSTGFVMLVGALSFPSVVSAEEKVGNEPRVEQYIQITDLEIGKVERIEIPQESVQKTKAKNKDAVTLEMNLNFDSLKKNKAITMLSDFTTQTVEKYLEGHNGAVRITYTDDGTFAGLDSFTARWYKDNGAVTVTNCSVNYGQVLGTNSKSGYSKMTGYGLKINDVGFKLGKYGYNRDHFSGAILNGKVGTKQIETVNHVFFQGK